MKHEEYIDRRIKHHQDMIEKLKAHKRCKLTPKVKSKIEKSYKLLDNYELVLRKKKQ
ncbi:MAG: hypothetical protein ACP5M9_01675 [Candidatus Micrarchaeia archaeon]